KNRLQSYHAMADQRWQARQDGAVTTEQIESAKQAILAALQNDLNTPEALAKLSELEGAIDNGGISISSQEAYASFLKWLDDALGLKLSKNADITDEQKQLIAQREQAREAKDWAKSDQLRDQLAQQ